MSEKLSPTDAGAALVETFPSIRIINLSSRSDRRREVQGELRKLGLSFETPGVGLEEAVRFTDKGSFPLVGARGCFHSHLNILERALAENSHILILEDDCDFTKNIEHNLSVALKQLATLPWSIFYGGHELVDQPADTTSVTETPPDTWILGGHFVGFHHSILKDLVAYVHQSLIEQTADPKNGAKGIDAVYYRFRKANPSLKTYLAWPKLGYQRPSRTDISPHLLLDEVPVARDFMGMLRRLKRKLGVGIPK